VRGRHERGRCSAPDGPECHQGAVRRSTFAHQRRCMDAAMQWASKLPRRNVRARQASASHVNNTLAERVHWAASACMHFNMQRDFADVALNLLDGLDEMFGHRFYRLTWTERQRASRGNSQLTTLMTMGATSRWQLS
jgi:hypothetical protein